GSMCEKVIAKKLALTFFGTAFSDREQPRQVRPARKTMRIGENVRRAVGEHQPRSGEKSEFLFLGDRMRTHYARDRVAAGKPNSGKAKRLGRNGEFFRMRAAAQERKIAGHGQLGISAGHGSKPCTNQCGNAASP